MKIAVVGTYPNGTFARFEKALAGCDKVELLEAETQEKFDALEDAYSAF